MEELFAVESKKGKKNGGDGTQKTITIGGKKLKTKTSFVDPNTARNIAIILKQSKLSLPQVRMCVDGRVKVCDGT